MEKNRVKYSHVSFGKDLRPAHSPVQVQLHDCMVPFPGDNWRKLQLLLLLPPGGLEQSGRNSPSHSRDNSSSSSSPFAHRAHHRPPITCMHACKKKKTPKQLEYQDYQIINPSYLEREGERESSIRNKRVCLRAKQLPQSGTPSGVSRGQTQGADLDAVVSNS